jgi:hypothetical protein
MSFSKATLSGNKVESNLELRHSIIMMQLMCSSGLLTFILFLTPNMFKIYVLPNEKDKPLPRKPKKNTMPFASVEDLGYTIFVGKNVQV